MFLQVEARESKNWWYVDSSRSPHITEKRLRKLWVIAYEGGSVGFKNGKKYDIIVIGKACKWHSHAIKNVYYVRGLKHNLLSVSWMCDKGNQILFNFENSMVSNEISGNLALKGKGTKTFTKEISYIHLKMKCYILVNLILIPLCGIRD